MTLSAAPRMLLVHAHPDDESLWTGGAIARYAAMGVRVTLVTCTLGEEGEVIPESLAGLAPDAADQLGGYRIGELRAACAALGVSDQRWLGGIGRWRDSGMAGETPPSLTGSAATTTVHPRAFASGDRAEQVEALRAVLAEVRPQVVITYGPDGGYGHPDHIRAHEITMAAVLGGAAGTAVPTLARNWAGVERIFYTVHSRAATERGLAELASVPDLPFRLPELAELPFTEDERITTAIQLGAARSAKLRALRAHATQVSVWQAGGGGPHCFALSDGVARPLPDTEYYLLAAGDPDGARDDLFAGPFGRAEPGGSSGAAPRPASGTAQ